jgi:hypothetical protein
MLDPCSWRRTVYGARDLTLVMVVAAVPFIHLLSSLGDQFANETPAGHAHHGTPLVVPMLGGLSRPGCRQTVGFGAPTTHRGKSELTMSATTRANACAAREELISSSGAGARFHFFSSCFCFAVPAVGVNMPCGFLPNGREGVPSRGADRSGSRCRTARGWSCAMLAAPGRVCRV